MQLARPATSLLRPALLVLGGSLAIAASAQVNFPMQPVPMTMQSLVVLLVGVAYGWKLGAATVLLYLAQGAMGLPVFAGFRSGVALVGPTAGYLFGFVAAAALAGWMAARGWTRGWWRAAVTLAAGHAVIFTGGLLWLSVPLGVPGAIAAGLLPFLPGTLVKVALGVALLAALGPALGRR